MGVQSKQNPETRESSHPIFESPCFLFSVTQGALKLKTVCGLGVCVCGFVEDVWQSNGLY